MFFWLPVSALDRDKPSVLPEVETTTTQPQPGLQRDIEGSDDLFAFITDETSLPSASTEDIVDEVDRYLVNTDVTITSLLQYPRLAAAFLKYNATLPSSAAVERLFSCAGQILVPRRCKLSDTMFEKLIFLRYKLKQK